MNNTPTPDNGDASGMADASGARPGAVTPLRRPYPTATTTTRLSPARDTTGPTQRTGPRTRSAVPATAWTFATPDAPTDPAPTRQQVLAQVLERVIASFAPPGATVAVLTWPTTAIAGPPSDAEDPAGGTGAPIDTVAVTPAAGEAVVAGARAAGYAARAIVVPEPEAPPGAADAWAGGDTASRVRQLPVRACSLDLIVTATGPDGTDEHSAERVALFAAHTLRVGGILAVLTHSDWDGSQLRDRTGTVVAAGQNADLLYLQHVVAVHGPVHHIDPRAQHAKGRHRRVHEDLLVLVQPRDHALDLPNTAAA